MTARLTKSGISSSSRWRRGLRAAVATLVASATAALSLATGVMAHAAPMQDSGNGTLQVVHSGPFKPGETVILDGSGFDVLPHNSQQLAVKLFSPDSGSGVQLRLPAFQKCGQQVDTAGTFYAIYAACLPDDSGTFTMPITLPDQLQDGSYELQILGAEGVRKHQDIMVQSPRAQQQQQQSDAQASDAASTAASATEQKQPDNSGQDTGQSTGTSQSQGQGGANSGSGNDPKGSLVCEDNEVTVTDGEGKNIATACVQRDVSTGSGKTIKLRGSGWKTTDGEGGSSVVLKLASRTDPTADDFQFVRTGGDILKHPRSKAPDATMWALVKAEKDGTFETTIPVPQKENVPNHVEGDGSLKAGSKLTVHFQIGLKNTDVSHSVSSKPLVVDGTEYAGDADAAAGTCVANGEASVQVEYPEGQEPNAETGPRFGFGDTAYLVGKNWCAEKPENGGSWIAVKIDMGNFSHREGEGVHANMSVWHIIKVDSADGSFREPIKLPERGDVPGGSSPEFTEGAHKFVLLTGSLKKGVDVHRVEETDPFTVKKAEADKPAADKTEDPKNPPAADNSSSASESATESSEPAEPAAGPVTGTDSTGDVSVTINKGTFAPGETVTVSGAGFLGTEEKGGVQPVLKLDGLNTPYDYDGPDAVKPSEFEGVPMFKSKEDGTFEGTVTLPDDITLGEHHFRALAGSFGAKMASTSFKIPFTVKKAEADKSENPKEPTEVNISASVGVNGSNDAKPGENNPAVANAAKPNATSGALASTGTKILIPLLIVIVVAAAIAGVMAYLRRNRNEQY